MTVLKRRIEKIEKTLSINKPIRQLRVILCCRDSDKALAETLGNVLQWASYEQYNELHTKETLTAFQPNPQLEIIARQCSLTPDELAALDFNGW